MLYQIISYNEGAQSENDLKIVFGSRSDFIFIFL